jgi:hypothetical protein
MVESERRWSRRREERSSTKGERCMHPVLNHGLTLSFSCPDFGCSSVKHAFFWSSEPISKRPAGTLWNPPKSCSVGYNPLLCVVVEHVTSNLGTLVDSLPERNVCKRRRNGSWNQWSTEKPKMIYPDKGVRSQQYDYYLRGNRIHGQLWWPGEPLAVSCLGT